MSPTASKLSNCDVPGRSPQKPWPGSSPSAKTSSDNHHENLVMSAKKNPVGGNDKATAVVADDWKETLKRVGGSQSDDWNHVLGNQAFQSLWVKQSDNEVRQRQYNAAIAGLIGIAPQDEIEGMIAAQLIAAHNATMECYRRAMIGEQTLEGRRDNLSQANKLSRTYAVLLDALNRYRGKDGQQKVTVEHVDVHAGGQAVVGMIESPRGGDQAKSEDQPRAKQIAHAPQPAVWSADKERQRVPVSGDAERPLPNARRDVSGRPKG